MQPCGNTFRYWLLAGALSAGWIPGSAQVQGVEISEFMAKNESTLATAEGLYEDWIEIHNSSGAAVDLAGYYLTDNPSDLRKWQFPSTAATSPLADDGYLVVFADDSVDAVVGNELHASFKLGSGGEYLALVEPDGETVAYQYNPEYPGQSADISYGVDAASGMHAYFAAPSPGSANGQAIADAVKFSADSGTFTVPFTLLLSVDSPTAEIRFTLDGTIPDANAFLYVAGIPVSTTARVRARAFESGLVDGPVVSETFHHLDTGAAAFSSDLPLVVVDNFGAGEIPDPLTPTRQSSQVMFFEPLDGVTRLTNKPSIASRAGIRRRGESSLRNTANKPNLSLETWGETDEEARTIKPFGFPAESDWILFAPWSFDRALMRNAFMYELSNAAGRYAVRTRFVEVFLNHDGGSLSSSDYYGVYVFMEKIKQGPGRVDVAELPDSVTSEPDISGGYVWKLDKPDPDDQFIIAAGKSTNGINVLSSVYPKIMPPAQSNWLVTAINDIDAAVPSGNYESLIDVESFADHFVLNMFAQNADGLWVSTFYHKDRNGLVQMGPIWDFDRSMGCDNDDRPSNPQIWAWPGNTIAYFRGVNSLWWKKLALNDAEFWMVMLDRWQRMRQGPLSDAANAERIERYRTELSTAALRNFDRWTQHIPSSEWTDKVDAFHNHVLARGQWVDDQFIDPPAFSQPGGLVPAGYALSLTGPEAKYFTLDGSDPRAVGGAPAGTAYSSPVTLAANTLVKARAWDGTSFGDAPTDWPWSALSEALFIVEPAPLAITEIMYHPRPPSGAAESGFTASDFEFIEVQNTSASVCSLVGVQLLEGVQFDFTYGNASTLGAGAHGVVVRNLEAFKARYTNSASLNILGIYSGRLSDSTENIRLGYDLPNLPALASFDYEDDWYPSTDGEGFSLVLIDPRSDPAAWDSKQAWRHSAGVDGSPGTADPAPAHPPGSVVINEVLSHQDTDNPGDWIELHNTTGSAIDVGGWFLSDSRGQLRKYAIPSGTVIPPNGYAVFTEHDHFGSAFALSEHGDSVYLSSGNGGELSEPAYRASQSFGGQDRDVTFGRHLRTDGVADFASLLVPTMGSANSGPKVGPIVIEEIMYNPPNGGHEYIRIRNTSGQAVPLYDAANPSNVWKVAGIDFEFPAGVQLAPDHYLLLVRDTITPSVFRQAYGIPPSVLIFSYAGALDNDADTILLKKPGAPEVATGYVPRIVVEQVKYNDSSPWPPDANGLGKALGRVNHAAYGNDSSNWQAVVPSYGPVMYELIVHSGSGDGEYAPGTLVAIEADPAGTNQAFEQWIGNVAAVADVGASSTSLQMPARDTTLTALYTAGPLTFIDADDVWKYHDLGQDLGTAWQAADYNDAAWASGAAQLGYGDGDETTVVGYGGVNTNKHVTTYFRKGFAVDEVAALTTVTLRLLRDDGAVVYVNGVEVARDGLPTGAIDYQTLANITVGGAAEDTFYEFALPVSVLDPGPNVIAVEIHQRARNSSDISFALQLQGVQSGNTAVLDGDADGMQDAWETNHFGSTEAGIPNVDSDGDGVWNIDEFVAGTLPDDPHSYFTVEAFSGSILSWVAMPGRTYAVEWSDDLRQPFTRIAAGLTGGTYADTQHMTNPVNYYRMQVELE